MKKIPDLIVTRNGVPVENQAEGLRQFKEACAVPPMPPVNVEIIVERAEQFTRQNLQALAAELDACKNGGKMDEDGKLKELYSKLLLAGKLPAPPMQIAIAMISNECVKFVAATKSKQSVADYPANCPACDHPLRES